MITLWFGYRSCSGSPAYFLLSLSHNIKMKKTLSAAVCLSLTFAVGVSGCKPKVVAPAAQTVVIAPATPVVAAAPAGAAPASVASNAAAPASFAELDKIPVIAKTLPQFPFIDYPSTVNSGGQFTTESDFDQMSVIVGNKLHTVEGRFKLTSFYLSDAKISEFQARRDYTKAALDMGGVKVNTAKPDDEAFVAANGGESSDLTKKTKFDSRASYDVYFLPTAAGRKWLVLIINDSKANILAIEEKITGSSVKMVTAVEMKSELEREGHVALYINFDTDKAAIRADGKPAVDQIVTLMKQESALRLAVEGHTDNVGDAAHNVKLSRERAQAVVLALRGDGIDAARLSAAGIGAAKPIADNANEEGRAKNRRVELVKVVKG
jgi:OOP family OmpA-OmpF porin